MNKLFKTYIVLLAFTLGAVGNTQAQTEEDLAAFARKAQDPLGDVKALMTDNTIGFNGGTDDSTTYGFQLQPVYAIDNDTSWNMILRGIVPVAGIQPSVVVVLLVEDGPQLAGELSGRRNVVVDLD
jgi:hypothetical protein